MADSKREDNYYREVSESIKSVFDLTSRIDERVKLLMKKQDELDRKLDERLQRYVEIDGRVRVLESGQGELNSLWKIVHTLELDLQQVKIKTTGHENKWKTIISFAVQIAWVILAAYLLMKLGIQAPAVP
jgi:predicted nuclease with TOPRIM domain